MIRIMADVGWIVVVFTSVAWSDFGGLHPVWHTQCDALGGMVVSLV